MIKRKIHNKRGIFKTEIRFDYQGADLNFGILVLVFGILVLENLSKIRKQWLIDVSEEPNMRSATLDTEGSLKHILIDVSLFLMFLADRKR